MENSNYDNNNPKNITAMKSITYPILFLLCLMSSFSVVAQETFVEGEFTYQVKAQGVSIISYSGTSDIVDLPDVVSHNGTDYTVIDIGNKLFFKDENLVSVTFPSTALSIGDSVCHECPNLSRVVIGDDTKTIGIRSFSACTKLMLVVLGKSLQLIKGGAFVGIENDMLNTLDHDFYPTFVFKSPDYPVIESDVLNIAGGASKRIYGLCPEENLSTYQASSKWKSEWEPNINFVLLSGYSQEELNNASLTLTSTSDTVPVNDFTYQDYLLHNNFEPAQAWWSKMNFSLQLPLELNSLKKWNKATSLGGTATIQDINSSDNKIYCSGQINQQGNTPVFVFTPQQAVKINCYSLPDAENPEDCYIIYCDENFKYKIFIEGNLFVAKVAGIIQDFNSFVHDEAYVIPDRVTFNTYHGERTVDIVAIDDEAFKDSPLVSIETGNNVRTIGERAFYGSRMLARVILGNAVQDIKKDAFANCDGLTLVVMGTSLSNIQEGNFVGSNQQNFLINMNGATNKNFILLGDDYPTVASDFIQYLTDSDVNVYCPADHLGTFQNSEKWPAEFNLRGYEVADYENDTILLDGINISAYCSTSSVVVFGKNDIEELGGDISNQDFTLKLPLKFSSDMDWNGGVINFLSPYGPITWTANNFYNNSSGIYVQGQITSFDPNKDLSDPIYAYLFTPKSFIRVPILAWSKLHATAITEIENQKQVVTMRYYNLAGVESAEPQPGVNLKVTTWSDGSRTTQKIIK